MNLRPLERRILRLRNDGIPDEEIARKFRRSPAMIERIAGYAEIPRPQTVAVPLSLLESLVDDNNCRFDGDDNCQQHGFFGLVSELCPQAHLKKLIADAKEATYDRGLH